MHTFKENGVLLCRFSAQLQLYRTFLLTDRGRGATVPSIHAYLLHTKSCAWFKIHLTYLGIYFEI